MRPALMVATLAVVLLLGCALWPVCIGLSPEQVASSRTTVEQRDEHMFLGPVCQQREGKRCARSA